MANKTPKFRGVENHKYAVEMHGLRSSGASGSHDNRPKRERTRANTRRAAIKQGW